MPITISLYNHTARRFADGSNSPTDTYKIKLFTAAAFSASDTTEAAAGGTEVANGSGYTTGGATLSNISVTTVSTNDAKFDADDVVWTVTGSNLSAAQARIYNATDANSPPLAFIDFGGTETRTPGNEFLLSWNASGIITWTV